MDDIKILVVGDGVTDIKVTIESLGYPVPYMVPLGEAVKKALDLMPDLIIMGLVFRENKNSWEFVSQIQKLNLPVIFLIDQSLELDFKEEFNFKNISPAEA